jgi:RimJ/RimL family protein N-acetyltransferase
MSKRESPEILSTERLVLEHTNVEDAEFLLRLMNTPQWYQYIGDRNVKSIEDARRYIEERIEVQRMKIGYSTYTVRHKKTKVKMGTVGFYDREELEGIDLGFAFLPEFERKGFALEASRALMKYAVNAYNVERLYAITINENKDSIRLLEKLEFDFVKPVILSNDNETLRLYQWTSIQAASAE